MQIKTKMLTRICGHLPQFGLRGWDNQKIHPEPDLHPVFCLGAGEFKLITLAIRLI
jgi:hypothetical protein